MNNYEKLLYKSNKQKHQLKILQDKCHKYKEVLDKIKEIIKKDRVYIAGERNLSHEIEELLEGDNK